MPMMNRLIRPLSKPLTAKRKQPGMQATMNPQISPLLRSRQAVQDMVPGMTGMLPNLSPQRLPTVASRELADYAQQRMMAAGATGVTAQGMGPEDPVSDPEVPAPGPGSSPEDKPGGTPPSTGTTPVWVPPVYDEAGNVVTPGFWSGPNASTPGPDDKPNPPNDGSIPPITPPPTTPTAPTSPAVPTDPQYEQALAELMSAYGQDRADILRQLGFTDPQGAHIPGLVDIQYGRDKRDLDRTLEDTVRAIDEDAVRSGTLFSGKRAKRQAKEREPITEALTQLASQLGMDKGELEHQLTGLETEFGLSKNRLLMELAERHADRLKDAPAPTEGQGGTGPGGNTMKWFGGEWSKKDLAAWRAEARKRGRNPDKILKNNPKLAEWFGWKKKGGKK